MGGEGAWEKRVWGGRVHGKRECGGRGGGGGGGGTSRSSSHSGLPLFILPPRSILAPLSRHLPIQKACAREGCTRGAAKYLAGVGLCALDAT